MTAAPLVSIVTPSFNQARFLPDCLESVRVQDYPNVEHIVMDGGSTDGSIDILRQFDREGLRWMSEPDRGQAHAINKALDLAEGEIIGWLNSDDFYLSTSTVSTVAAAFEQRPAVDVLYGHAAYVNVEKRLIMLRAVANFSRGRLAHDCFIEQPAVFMRRRATEGARLDDGLSYAMDYDYWLRLAESFRFQRVNAVLAVDRWHEDRKMVAAREELAAESRAVARRWATATLRGRGPGTVRRLAQGANNRVLATYHAWMLRNRTDLAVAVEMPPFYTLAWRHATKRDFLAFGRSE